MLRGGRTALEESAAMGWEAQAAAGVGFLIVGMLQGFKQVKSYRLRNMRSYSMQHGGSRRKSWYHDLELYLVLIFALSHVICDVVVGSSEGDLKHPVAVSVNSQRLVVAINFLFYAIVTLIVDNTNVLPIPPELISLIALSAFGQEFLLFYLQRDSAGLEGQYHYLLLVPIGVCAGSTVAEIAYPKSVLPPLIRSMGLVLQGTWFIQTALSLFSPKWIAQGCTLREEGEGDYTVACEGESSNVGFFRLSLFLTYSCVLKMPTFCIFLSALGMGNKFDFVVSVG